VCILMLLLLVTCLLFKLIGSRFMGSFLLLAVLELYWDMQWDCRVGIIWKWWVVSGGFI